MTGTPQSAQPDDVAAGKLVYWQGLFNLPQAIWLPILAMFVVAIVAFAFNEWSVNSIRASSDQMTKLEAMRGDLIALRLDVAEAESNQRGYLLSADPKTLEAFDKALLLAVTASARLQDQASIDPLLLVRAQKLESLRSRDAMELRATVTLTRLGHQGDASSMARAGRGRIVTDAFRLHATEFLAELAVRVAKLRGSISHNAKLARIAVAALALLTLMLLMMAIRLLVKDYWRQEHARQGQAHERRRLERIVGERTAELSALTTHLQTVTEQEKADLARNLHDELGGLLTAAKMDLSWLQGRASAKEPDVHEKLDALASGIDDAMDIKRRVVENLRPALLDHFGLSTTLQDYFSATCQKAGLGLKSSTPEEFERIPQDVSIALFRVGQEALTNIIRHASAKNVELTLENNVDKYRISIADDGVGINPTKLSGAMTHGLVGMRHRIAALNGQFKIGANLPHGTCIEVTVPKTVSL